MKTSVSIHRILTKFIQFYYLFIQGLLLCVDLKFQREIGIAKENCIIFAANLCMYFSQLKIPF